LRFWAFGECEHPQEDNSRNGYGSFDVEAGVFPGSEQIIAASFHSVSYQDVGAPELQVSDFSPG
jgi:hypothetical protein